MRRHVFALACVVVAAAPARADEPRLPFNPFEKVKKGDWSVVTGTLKTAGADGESTKCAILRRVVRVDDDEVALTENRSTGKIDKKIRVFSRSEAPLLAAFLGLEGGTIADLKVEDAKKKVGDDELDAKKVTFVWKVEGAEEKVTALFSSDVRAGGLVSLDMERDGRRLKLSCKGAGRGERVEHGEAADALVDADLLEDADEGALPYHPFAGAKKGDWTALRISVDMNRRDSESGVVLIKVVKVEDDAVKVRVDVRKEGRAEPESSTVDFDLRTPPSAVLYLMTLFGETNKGGRLKAENMKVADAKKTLDEKEFAGKRLSFGLREGDASMAKVKMWLSTEVKGAGFVAAEAKIQDGSKAGSLTMELKGYGHGDEVEWGKSFEDLLKKKKKKKSDDDDE